MSRLVVIATPGCYLSSIGAIMDAHVRLGEIYANNPAMRDFAQLDATLALISLTGGNITLAGGQDLRATGRLAMNDTPRAVFLPSFQLTSGQSDFAPLHAWLLHQHGRGIPIAAAGAGVRHLSAAGLLDGRHVSVHPRHADYVRRTSPNAIVEAGGEVIGAGNLWTCAREADAMHLVLRLFAAAYSPEVANDMERIDRVSGYENPRSLSHDPLVAEAQIWMRDHFTQSFRVGDIAHRLGVSHATLIRRFEASAQMTPRAFVQQLRVTAAAVMLTETGRRPAEIAQLVGYADLSAFRQVFRATYGMAPAVYRRTRLGSGI